MFLESMHKEPEVKEEEREESNNEQSEHEDEESGSEMNDDNKEEAIKEQKTSNVQYRGFRKKSRRNYRWRSGRPATPTSS